MLFQPERHMKLTSAEYIVSAVEPSQFPTDRLPELAFAGRSNVGKSSLLNCLVGRDIARASRTPGKTRAINFFLINREFYFVDLPGYGYARVSKQMRQSWQQLMEGYIGNRPNLRAVVVIIDARREIIPPQDLQMVDYLHSVRVPCIPALTKADKLSRSELAHRERSLKTQLASDAQPLFFSAVTGLGKTDLWRRIAICLA